MTSQFFLSNFSISFGTNNIKFGTLVKNYENFRGLKKDFEEKMIESMLENEFETDLTVNLWQNNLSAE